MKTINLNKRIKIVYKLHGTIIYNGKITEHVVQIGKPYSSPAVVLNELKKMGLTIEVLKNEYTNLHFIEYITTTEKKVCENIFEELSKIIE